MATAMSAPRGIELCCGVCFRFYNESDIVARRLDCKHILCEDCAWRHSIQSFAVKCPFCKVVTLKPADDLDPSFGALRDEEVRKKLMIKVAFRKNPVLCLDCNRYPMLRCFGSHRLHAAKIQGDLLWLRVVLGWFIESRQKVHFFSTSLQLLESTFLVLSMKDQLKSISEDIAVLDKIFQQFEEIVNRLSYPHYYFKSDSLVSYLSAQMGQGSSLLWSIDNKMQKLHHVAYTLVCSPGTAIHMRTRAKLLAFMRSAIRQMPTL